MRSGDPRAGLSHARPGLSDPQPCGAEIRSGKHMVGGRKGSAGGSKRLLSQEAVSMATGGVFRLTRGRSSQQGLPRPASWGRPRSFGPGAPVSGRAGRG